MAYKKLFPIIVLIIIFCFPDIGWCGKIIYPWNATTAIVKSGESFTIWFDADKDQTVENIKLQGPYNSVSLVSFTTQKGFWLYDDMSGKMYNTQITVHIPANTPEELYDLILNTSAAQEISQSSVKVIRKYKSEYTIFHISDTHICKASGRQPDGTPKGLRYLSVLVNIANIIGPEIVFITGDNVNSISYDEKNSEYLTTWPSTQERIDFFYKGSHKNGYSGVYDFAAAAFTVNGNHDNYERPPDGNETKNKFEFWNKYHGVRTHHFSYANTRFMALSDALGEEHEKQVRQHTKWLKQVGSGNLRIIYKHIYNQLPERWLTDVDINVGLCGHNHHIGKKSPYKQAVTDMYIVNCAEYTTFNLFNVNHSGKYTVANNLTAIENHRDEPADFRPKLTLDFEKSNDGTSTSNLATLVNKFNIGFPKARIRFIMPKGTHYTISKGTIEQQFDGDSVCVVDVTVALKANCTTSVKIHKTK